ncbi:DUF2878 domain-containing protein [Arenimonas alkanexedens]
MNQALRTASNVLGYQAVWFASVAGAGAGYAWAGPAAALVFVAATLALGGQRARDLRLLALALPLGILLDTAFAASGWLRYAEPWPFVWAAPVWIWSLWAGFTMTLNHSMAFLRERPLAASLLGLFGGPLAYWAAAKGFDAVSFGAPFAWVMGALALGWALVLPALFALDSRLASPAPKKALA